MRGMLAPPRGVPARLSPALRSFQVVSGDRLQLGGSFTVESLLGSVDAGEREEGAHLEHLAAAHEEHAVEVDAVHVGTVVGEHGGERPADNLAAIDDDDHLAAHTVAEWEGLVVDLEVLHQLDDG
jgi:hypothetical protein